MMPAKGRRSWAKSANDCNSPATMSASARLDHPNETLRDTMISRAPRRCRDFGRGFHLSTIPKKFGDCTTTPR